MQFNTKPVKTHHKIEEQWTHTNGRKSRIKNVIKNSDYNDYNDLIKKY